MDQCGYFGGGSLRLGIDKWQSVKGGTDKNGSPVKKPIELEIAEVIDGLCQRYSCLPSEVLQEDIEVLRLVDIVSMVKEE